MTDTHLSDNRRDGAHPVRPGPLGRLAGLCFRRRGMVLLAWLLGLGLAIGLSAAFGGEKVNGASLPGSDSAQAQTLLEDRFPAQSGDRIDVVFGADDVASDEVRRQVGALLAQLKTMPHVAEVEDPYATENAIVTGRADAGRTRLPRCRQPERHAGRGHRADAGSRSRSRGSTAWRSRSAGRAVQFAEAPDPGGTELLGLIAAAVILLITFGSLVAAGLPLAVAIGGLLVSSSLVGLTAVVTDVPDFAPLIGAMLGIAVGIDYALLMVTRFREWRAVGLDPETATVATLDTAGRAVLVAGSTVVVSMAGLFAMGLSIMNGTAVVTMVAVLVVMARCPDHVPRAAGLPGTVDRPPATAAWPSIAPRLSQPTGTWSPRAGWVRWSQLGAAAQRARRCRWHRSPRRTGPALPRVSSSRCPTPATTPRTGPRGRRYDMLADGFGPGDQRPVARRCGPVRGADAGPALERLHSALEAAAGVAAVSPPRVNPAGDTALITVMPLNRATGRCHRGSGAHGPRRRDPGRHGRHRCPGATSAEGLRRRSTSTPRLSIGCRS